ncbi:MAG: hypothetical protein RLZZ350_1621 [Verrucomicrobiota bacterium]|jgi:hypothetical protein
MPLEIPSYIQNTPTHKTRIVIGLKIRNRMRTSALLFINWSIDAFVCALIHFV